MEEIAEQSYDAMEAYILFKKKIDEKMADADKEFDKIQKDYCDRNNIQLVEGPKTEMSEKMNAIGTVSDYYDEMYLIFFKASIHDEQMVEAMEAKNLTALEQIKGSLLKYAEEGLAKLDTFRAYKNDGSLRLSCRKAMEFYKKEASMLETVTDYFLKVEDFETVKKNFERNPKAKSDQKEIDKYNAAVKEMNKSLEKFNQTIQSMNKGRADVINNWNETGKRFFDTHMPYGK
jgi:peptidoglycan hydrolase CwlO-like protein